MKASLRLRRPLAVLPAAPSAPSSRSPHDDPATRAAFLFFMATLVLGLVIFLLVPFFI